MITSRKYCQIKTEVFQEDLEESVSGVSGLSTSPLVERYNSVFAKLTDKYDPAKERRVISRPQPSRYTNGIPEAKKICSKAGRYFYDTSLMVNQEIYKDRRREMSGLIDQAKQEYFDGRITLFNQGGILKDSSVPSVNCCIVGSPSILSSHDSRDELLKRFAEFFAHKITKILSDLAAVRELHQHMTEDLAMHASHQLQVQSVKTSLQQQRLISGD